MCSKLMRQVSRRNKKVKILSYVKVNCDFFLVILLSLLSLDFLGFIMLFFATTMLAGLLLMEAVVHT